MKNIILTTLLTVLFSLFYFQVEFYALPGINTKMMIAVCGLVVLMYRLLVTRSVEVPKIFFGIYIISLLFSLVSYISIVVNNTDDFVYATYFVKMSVWLFGAYFVVNAITWAHGKITIKLVFHYLALLCVMQCLLALLIDNIPGFENWVRRVFDMNYKFFDKNERLYGIGAAYDTAGIRFTSALLGMIYLMKNKQNNKDLYFYLLMWVIIVVIGSAMSRTTSIGAILSLCYLLFSKLSFGQFVSYRAIKLFMGGLVFMAIALSIVIYCYNHIAVFKEYMDFGFENFFNYSESGEFTSRSTKNLMDMFIWPTKLKTWIIGDALFDVPGGFYMGTDVGYLRLIYYCGLTGLLCFLTLFIFCTIELSRKWPHLKGLFITLLIWQLIAWIKIPTDIFVVFALLTLVPQSGDKIEPIFNK